MTDEERQARRDRIKTKLERLAQALFFAGLPALAGAITNPDLRKGAEFALQAGKVIGSIRNNNIDEGDITDLAVMIEKKDPHALKEAAKLDETLSTAMINAIVADGQQVTDRHAADMSGDSTFAKNVRPAIACLVVLCQIVLTVIMALNWQSLTASSVGVYTLYTGLTASVCGFYFGSRKAEKIENLKQYYSKFISQR